MIRCVRRTDLDRNAAGFLVADEITLISCRAGLDAKSVQRIGHIDGTFITRPANRVTEPGTRVFLRLRPEAARDFSANKIFEISNT